MAESTAEKLGEVLDVVERIAAAFERAREAEDDEDGGREDAAADRDELLAEVLDESEEAQAVLAAALSFLAGTLAGKVQDGDEEAAALAAVVLRSLSAHSQAEAVRSLMESPDLSQFVNVSEDDDDGHGGDDV
jgi:hypothetical protein